MGDSNIDLLAVREWVPAHAAQVGYTGPAAQETPPVPSPDIPSLQYRFARVHAIDGALLVRVVQNGGANPTLSTGDFRVFIGTSETLQIPYKATVWVQALAGTVNGAVVWGR